jgi:hypothetical protein
MLRHQSKASYFLRIFTDFQFSAFGRQTSMDALVASGQPGFSLPIANKLS